MKTAIVSFRIAGTACNESWTAEQIHIQLWDSGRAKLDLLDGEGRMIEQVLFRRADTIRLVNA